MTPETRRHILMVDDEVQNLRLFQRLFRHLYHVHTAESGREGLKVMERENIEIVVCDQRMPEMTGIEFLEAVRRRFPRSARIIVTAYLDVKVAIDAINRGQVSRYISKPWDNVEMAALIEQELKFVAYEEENERLALDLHRRNAELEKANIELMSIDRAKSEFVSTMTHELKTPLLSSLGYLDLLLSGRAGDVGQRHGKFVQKAFDNMERLKDLVEDLVDFSTLERGLDGTVLSVFNFTSILEKQIGIAEMQAREKSIEISKQVPKDPIAVKADMSQIGQALSNLLGNAVKFTNRGGSIKVTVESVDQTARVEVTDTGIGIPPEHLDLVFDRFYQVDSSSTRRFGGTGIGLSIVKTVTELHHGEYGVSSTPGVGSTFWFSIPCLVEDDVERPSKTPLRYKDIVVGLVDPDTDALTHARTVLVNEGFNAIVGESLEDARHMAASRGVDLFLIDESLLPSHPTASPLRTQGKDLGIYILRSSPANGLSDRLQAMGAEGTLPKPLRASDLMAIVLGRLRPVL
jgi:signal transduction histidine kinase